MASLDLPSSSPSSMMSPAEAAAAAAGGLLPRDTELLLRYFITLLDTDAAARANLRGGAIRRGFQVRTPQRRNGVILDLTPPPSPCRTRTAWSRDHASCTVP
jgi:hypothetical protein